MSQTSYLFFNRVYNMDKDQMAIYLSEHPEFFNNYPELLKTIKLEIQSHYETHIIYL